MLLPTVIDPLTVFGQLSKEELAFIELAKYVLPICRFVFHCSERQNRPWLQVSLFNPLLFQFKTFCGDAIGKPTKTDPFVLGISVGIADGDQQRLKLVRSFTGIENVGCCDVEFLGVARPAYLDVRAETSGQLRG